MFLGTIVNVLAVALGSLIGLFFRKNFPESLRKILFQGLGLCTLAVGITMILKVENLITVIFSVVLGGITGELLKLQECFDGFGNWLKKRLKSDNEKFTEGLVSAFLIFCVGAMTIMGAMDEGLRGNHTLLFTKSMLDGFTSIALAATFGSGVFFSTIPLLVYQGALTLFASWAQGFFTEAIVHQLTSVGGVLVLGIGINLLEIQKIKVTNLLPSLVFIVILTNFIH